MARARWLLAAATLVLTSACNGGAAPTHKVVTAARSAAPGQAAATPSSTPAASKAPASGLLKPQGDVREVTGTVLLDGNYAVAKAGAHVISNNGASVLQLAGIVSDNGGGVIANNGAGRRVLATDVPAIGTPLPAEGLTVRVVDLADGKDLPLGQDAAGQAVTSVKTDAAGKYKLYVPASGTHTLRVLATPPNATDDRLTAEHLLADEATLDLDDASTAVANYIRESTAANFQRLLRSSPEQAAAADVYAWMPAGLLATIKVGRPKLVTACRDLGWQALPEARQHEISARLADLVIGRLDLANVPTFGGEGAEVDVPVRPVVAAFQDIMVAGNGQAVEVLKVLAAKGLDPEAHFAADADVVEANANLKAPFAIRKASDFAAFLVRGVLANPAYDDVQVSDHLSRLLLNPDLAPPLDQVPLLQAAARGLGKAVAEAMYLGTDPASAAVLATVRAELGK